MSLDSDRAPAAPQTLGSASATLMPSAGPPAGALLGDAATVLREVRRASLRGREKDLLLYLFECTYLNRPRKWPEGDPRYGWVYVDLADVAEEMEDSIGNISARLGSLVEQGVLGREVRGGAATQYYWLTHPDTWDPTLRGRGRAKAMHARPDTGPRTRAERQMQPLLTREQVIEYIAASNYALVEPLVEAHWKVCDAFQTIFAEPMQLNFVEQLSHLLVEGQWRPDELIAWMNKIKLYNKYQYPWGYLLRCLSTAPRLTPHATESPKVTSATRPSTRRTKERPDVSAANAKPATGRKHGRFSEFVADAADHAAEPADAKADVS